MPAISELIQEVENCHRHAARASDPLLKAHWLKLAQAWMVMVEAAKSGAAAAPTDTNYQVSLVEKDGHSVAASAVVKSANDAEIIGKAKQLVDGKTVEVHQGQRLVASFPPSK